MFALVAVAARDRAARVLADGAAAAPLAPAGYIGAALALVGAEMGGVDWMIGGVLTTFSLAFVLKAISEARQAATVAISGDGHGRALGRRRALVPRSPA